MDKINNDDEILKAAAALEAVLFAAGSPLASDKLVEILPLAPEAFQAALSILRERYSSVGSGIELIEIENSLQLCTKSAYADNVKAALELKKLPPLSKAALEVLAITAYNQPVTRSFIEQVRGVESSSIVSSLCDKGLLRESGYLDAPGKPALFVTTESFLRCFGLASLDELSSRLGELALSGEEDENNITISDILKTKADEKA